MKNARDSGGRTLKEILNKKLAYIPSKRFSKWEEEDIRMILKAEECFKHQLIFNTKTKNIEPLGESLKTLGYFGLFWKIEIFLETSIRKLS